MNTKALDITLRNCNKWVDELEETLIKDGETIETCY